VLLPCVSCSERLACIYPPEAVAIINSNFDMAPLGLLVHAGKYICLPWACWFMKARACSFMQANAGCRVEQLGFRGLELRG
jgi:hypothetical protein